MTDQAAISAEQRRRVDLPWYKRLTVPPLTPIASPLSVTLDLPRGESEYLWLEMPLGCAGLVGVQVWRYTWQVFPRPAGDWYVSNGTTVKFRFREVFDDDPAEVEIRAYNLDSVETHRPWLAFEMIAVRSRLAENVAALLDFLGRG